MSATESSHTSSAAQPLGGALVLDFAGRRERLSPDATFVVGRGADLSIDDNPYVHRRFLEISHREGMWWLSNVGSGLTASVASADGLAQSWLTPGATMPLVFGGTVVMFTAGSVTYELSLTAESPFYKVSATWKPGTDAEGVAELLSPVQRIMLTAFAEPMLRSNSAAVNLPSLAEVATRLNWSSEKLERRANTLLDKFARLGIGGLERAADGTIPDAARTRLVEHVVGARIVRAEDLEVLDAFVVQDAPFA